MGLFDGFSEERVVVDGLRWLVRRGGDGPPLLLLHGYPQCGVAWHRLAPRLADRHALVIPDLPGYGDSAWRGPDAAHEHQSKRRLAAEVVALMAALGHQRFAVCGHDRGGRVAYRMALDHPGRVARLVAVDLVPTVEVWDAMDGAGARRTFHWPFLAQPAPLPEQLIGGAPGALIDHLIAAWQGRPGALDPAAVDEYRRHHADPETIAAFCEDYRAGATIDVAHDRADRDAGRRIACPTLLVWGRRYFGASPLPVWRRWADDVREVALDCGHFVAEEEPEATAAALRDFLA